MTFMGEPWFFDKSNLIIFLFELNGGLRELQAFPHVHGLTQEKR